MLTCFKHNPAAQKFFKGALKYEIDETCPGDDVYEQHDYEVNYIQIYELLSYKKFKRYNRLLDLYSHLTDMFPSYVLQIVSKFNKRKLAKERAEEMELNKMMPNRPQTMSTSSCCNGVHAH